MWMWQMKGTFKKPASNVIGFIKSLNKNIKYAAAGEQWKNHEKLKLNTQSNERLRNSNLDERQRPKSRVRSQKKINIIQAWIRMKETQK